MTVIPFALNDTNRMPWENGRDTDARDNLGTIGNA